MFVDLLKEILNFAIALEKKYNEKFVANLITDFVKHIMGSGFLTGIDAQPFERYIPVAKMNLRHQISHPLVESLNASAPQSKSLEIFHLEEGGLYVRQ